MTNFLKEKIVDIIAQNPGICRQDIYKKIGQDFRHGKQITRETLNELVEEGRLKEIDYRYSLHCDCYQPPPRRSSLLSEF